MRRKGEKGLHHGSALSRSPFPLLRRVLSSPSRPFAFSPLRLFLLLIVALSLTLAGACKRGAASTLERAAAAWDAGDYAPAAEAYERYLDQYPTGDESLRARLKLA